MTVFCLLHDKYHTLDSNYVASLKLLSLNTFSMSSIRLLRDLEMQTVFSAPLNLPVCNLPALARVYNALQAAPRAEAAVVVREERLSRTACEQEDVRGLQEAFLVVLHRAEHLRAVILGGRHVARARQLVSHHNAKLPLLGVRAVVGSVGVACRSRRIIAEKVGS